MAEVPPERAVNGFVGYIPGSMAEATKPAQKFDAYAGNYDHLVNQSIEASGESKEYFLDYKLRCLQRLGLEWRHSVLDYGCGTGNIATTIASACGHVEGYDPSPESLARARERSPHITFHDDPAAIGASRFDFAVLSGVLHHVPSREQRHVMETVLSKLKPGGRVVVFEHNPWNPVTRRAVEACPFDDDAVLLWPWQVRRLLNGAGFHDVRLEYIVFFPQPFAWLRPLEPRLRWLGLGAQTMTIGVRPA